MSGSGRVWAGLGLLAVSAAAAAALSAIEPPAANVEESRSASRFLVVDYDLFSIVNGTESLADTTRYLSALEANATAGYRLREPTAYVPYAIAWENLSRPRAVVEHVLAKVDRAALRSGERLDLVVESPVGRVEDLRRGTVPRVQGPYPATWEVSRADFERTQGRAPAPGDVVNTTTLFAGRVEGVDGDVVRLRVALEPDDAVVSRQLAAVFNVRYADDGATFFLVLKPIRDAIFTLADGNAALGLPPGSYLWVDVTDDDAEYVGHPSVAPVFVGVDYRIAAEVVEGWPGEEGST